MKSDARSLTESLKPSLLEVWPATQVCIPFLFLYAEMLCWGFSSSDTHRTHMQLAFPLSFLMLPTAAFPSALVPTQSAIACVIGSNLLDYHTSTPQVEVQQIQSSTGYHSFKQFVVMSSALENSILNVSLKKHPGWRQMIWDLASLSGLMLQFVSR